MMPSVLNTDSIPSVPKCNWCTKCNELHWLRVTDRINYKLFIRLQGVAWFRARLLV